MPSCPACGVAMTPDEWNSGSCIGCRAPLLEPKHHYEPAAAFDPTSPASVKINDHHRPAWGTVRAAFGLQILGVLLLWFGAGSMSSLGLTEYSLHRTPPTVAIVWTVSLISSAGAWFCLTAGFIFSAAVPSVDRVRQWIAASLLSAVVAVVLFCFLNHMTGTNKLEGDLQVRRDHYLEALDVKTANDTDAWKESLWSETAIKTTAWSALFAAAFALITYVLFVMSLTNFLRRRKLRRVILGLCAALIFIASCLAALVSAESMSPDDLSRGLREATQQQAVNAFLFILMAALTIYAGCCWMIRQDIATLLRGEHLQP